MNTLAQLRDAITAPWRQRAACRDADVDPALFFSRDPDDIAQAIAVCRGCPVSDECAEQAITTGQDWGIWGALTAKQRNAARRRHGRSRRPDVA